VRGTVTEALAYRSEGPNKALVSGWRKLT
jgi:hypothetical protein